MTSDSREIEAALIVWSETPQLVVSQVVGLTSIGNYRLLPQDSQVIHDMYLDTPDRALQAPQMALRVREIGETCWITLKGPSQPTAWKRGVKRLEIEAIWSEEAVTRVVEELMVRGIKVLQPWQDIGDVQPLDVMASIGFEVVQDRESHRRIRNILEGKKGSPVLAELAIDSVIYHFGSRKVCFHEVEIEAKAEEGSAVIETVVESLVTTYRPALRVWDYSKLATGKAIEELLKMGAIQELLDVNNNLKPAAFDKLSDYLKTGDV